MTGCAVETGIVNQSRTEITHLKATIVALREQLETLSFDKDKAVQRAVLLSSDEIQQLKDMASSLRSELENLRFEKDAAVQRAVQSSADEIQQLKTLRLAFGVNWKICDLKKMQPFKEQCRVLQMKFSN